MLKVGLPSIKNVPTPLAKRVLIPLGLTAGASAADVGIHTKVLGSGISGYGTKTQLISNKEMKDIMKIDKCLEYFGLLIKGVSQIIKNETKQQRTEFLCMLLGTSDASLLKNMLIGKGVRATKTDKGDLIRAVKGVSKQGKGCVVRASDGVCTAGEDF